MRPKDVEKFPRQTSKDSIMPQGLNDKCSQKQDIRLAEPFEPGVGDHLTEISYISGSTTPLTCT